MNIGLALNDVLHAVLVVLVTWVTVHLKRQNGHLHDRISALEEKEKP